MCQTETTVIKDQRLYFDNVLRSISGIKAVYHQPPASTLLKYPCVIYELSDYQTTYADNIRLFNWPTYSVELIDYDVESEIHKELMNLRTEVDENCFVQFDRFYTADNLNHWTYKIAVTKKSW